MVRVVDVHEILVDEVPLGVGPIGRCNETGRLCCEFGILFLLNEATDLSHGDIIYAGSVFTTIFVY